MPKSSKKNPNKTGLVKTTAPKGRLWLSDSGFNFLAGFFIVTATVMAYSNTFSVPFLLDDLHTIISNQSIRNLWPIWVPFQAPVDSGITGRPMANFTLAINFAISGQGVWSYHLLNLLIHVSAALFVFGIIRLTLLREPLRSRYGQVAHWLALTVAMLWALHPLHTSAVTYIIQRCESQMGLFFLATVYLAIRGWIHNNLDGNPNERTVKPCSAPKFKQASTEASRGSIPGDRSIASHIYSDTVNEKEAPGRFNWWHLGAVLVCLAGMGTKEVMVAAPVIIFLFDLILVHPSLSEALKRSRWLYAGLTLCLVVMGALVMSGEKLTGRWLEGAYSPWQQLATQPQVILYYLRLALWPTPLCFDYRWPPAESAWEIGPYASVILILLMATAWALWRRRPVGLIGAWFFIILAPSSSFIPQPDFAFEYRMYVPLVAVVLLVVGGGYQLARYLVDRYSPARPHVSGFIYCIAAFLGIGAAITLGTMTFIRNFDFQSEYFIWADTIKKRPKNHLAHANLGNALMDMNRVPEAVNHFRQALALSPNHAPAHYNLGTALDRLGKPEEALVHLQEAIRLKPDYALAHSNLGLVLVRLGRVPEALEQFRLAIKYKLDYVEAYNNLGAALMRLGRQDEAIVPLQQAIKIEPNHADTYFNLGQAYLMQNKLNEALSELEKYAQLKPDSADALDNLSIVLIRLGRIPEAVQYLQKSINISPSAPRYFNMGLGLAQLGRQDEALRAVRQALALDPGYQPAQQALAIWQKEQVSNQN